MDDAMDDATPENLRVLRRIAEAITRDGDRALDDLCGASGTAESA
jgi:hypothetical protein